MEIKKLIENTIKEHNQKNRFLPDIDPLELLLQSLCGKIVDVCFTMHPEAKDIIVSIQIDGVDDEEVQDNEDKPI